MLRGAHVPHLTLTLLVLSEECHPQDVMIGLTFIIQI